MLSAYPWDQRPDNHPLTAEEVCSALAETDGSIRRAAELLRVGSLVLRKFVLHSARARAVIREMDACLMDDARTRVREALDSDSALRNDWAARYVLNSANAKALGWASQSSSADASNAPSITLIMPPAEWENGELISQKEAARQVLDLVPSRPVEREPANDS